MPGNVPNTGALRTAACAALSALVLSFPSVAQDVSPAGDSSDKGAVLCIYAMQAATQFATRVCGWKRTPSDDAIDRSIGDIEKFMGANTKIGREAPDLARLRAGQEEIISMIARDGQSCTVGIADGGSPLSIFWMARTQSPAEIAANMADLLSVPREPVMNPCF